MLIKKILNAIQTQMPRNKEARKLLDIYDGMLYKYVDIKLKSELSQTAYEAAKGRIPPINILTKLVEKLSGIYSEGVTRTVNNAREDETKLVKWYTEKLDLDDSMQIANEYFAFMKTALIQPYMSSTQEIQFRIIPEDHYYVYSENTEEPSIATHIIICNGLHENKHGRMCERYIVYSDFEVMYFDDEGETYQATEENIYGQIPFVYINRSKNSLVPNIDLDLRQMTELFPLLLTDLNFAIKFQSFSIIALIDADVSNLKMSPSAIWSIKSLMGAERQASVQSIKPTVDIDQVSKHILSQLSMWLNTKGLKSSGIVGGAEGMASAISKLVDESDASNLKKKQVSIFKKAEKKLWDLILFKMHPVWILQNIVENKTIFSNDNSVQTNFLEQVPFFQRSDLIDSVNKEIGSQLLSRDSAMKRLNPEWSQDKIDIEQKKIKEESTIEVNIGDKMATN